MQSNAGAHGDNRNPLVSASRQTTSVLMKVAISINGAASDLVTAIGGQAERVNTAQTVDSAINAHSLADVQSVSYVILGEEASNPMQFQDAYYASARAMSIGFDGD